MRAVVKKAFVFAVALGSLTSAGYVSSFGDIVYMQCREVGPGPTITSVQCSCTGDTGFTINIVAEAFCPIYIKYNVKTNTWSK